jgi:hypothetical protein
MKTILTTGAFVGALMATAAGTATAATPYECDVYATNYAEQQYPTGGGAFAGGVGGGILGGIIAGATGGKVGNGVAIGATAGLVVGSVAWQNQKRQAHDSVYAQCLNSNQRTYALAPQPYYGEPGYAPQPYYTQPYYGEPVYAPQPSYVPYAPFAAVVVGVPAISLRTGPGPRYGSLGQVYAQQAISIASCDGTWCQVEMQNGGVGYIPQNYIRPI